MDMLYLIRHLLWWLPKCSNCGWRKPGLNEGVCFDCSVMLAKTRMWRGIADAAVQIAPYFVEAMTDYVAESLSRSVRRHHRRNPGTHRKPGFSEEIRELKRISDLSEPSPVEPPKPAQDETPGEAKA
jgi:hypothetical protein